MKIGKDILNKKRVIFGDKTALDNDLIFDILYQVAQPLLWNGELPKVANGHRFFRHNRPLQTSVILEWVEWIRPYIEYGCFYFEGSADGVTWIFECGAMSLDEADELGRAIWRFDECVNLIKDGCYCGGGLISCEDGCYCVNDCEKMKEAIRKRNEPRLVFSPSHGHIWVDAEGTML